MAMNLDQDYTVNGQTFKAGKNVETTATVVGDDGKPTKVDYAESIKEMQKASQAAGDFANTHHGAVPLPNDPQEATAGTPTRPLAAPNLAGSETATTATEVTDVHEVKDPGDNSADESNKKAN